MMRLSRVFEGSWAWMACGTLALLGTAYMADIPAVLRGWISGPAEQAVAPVNWVVDPGQYPPALLRVPGQIAPGDLGDVAEAARNEDLAMARGATSRAAGFNDQESPQEGEAKSILRRLPEVETLRSPESELAVDQWLDERLPEFAGQSSSGDNSHPRTADSHVSQELDFNRPDTASLPSGGGSFRETEPAVETPMPSSPPVATVEQPDPTSPIAPAIPKIAIPPVAPHRPANPQAMLAVSNRANELSRHGFALAQRGALYSARAEFIQALRLLSQALDAEREDGFHSQSLAAGLLALEEADDFVPKGSELEANLNVASVAVSHQTPVLKEATNVTPLAAVQKYYTYGQEQLAQAGGRQPAASAALYGLGRIQLALSDESVDSRRLSGPKALAMHQAALLVDPRNHRAANELGVLLARYGQLNEAKRVLIVGLSASREREAWHNLAVVHERLGETDLAKRARYEEQLLAGGASPPASDDSLVKWVSVKEFATTGHRVDSAAPAPAVNSQPPSRTAAIPKTTEKKSGSFAWPWK